ncbi:nitrite reductase small subunit NirD [Microbacterium oryzae]|uniref:nitrite reductase small subunit NirD n=1 Tax=Microbacterium oryzae TaxID=743009 RepID=UPI0025B0C188|nr:nitrite reductase small subunit NirD [Microbacterium oryzae]MDN3309499.1 nitrite reductase small subunit NirD [Microbacterium oryzae]
MTLLDVVTAEPRTGWLPVCAVGDLEVERGRAALVEGEQVALFLLHSGRVHAVSNRDPYSGAHVIARGIVGTRQDAPTVASPMYKQVFDLRTGACLDAQGKEPTPLRVWPAAVSEDGLVLIQWKALA